MNSYEFTVKSNLYNKTTCVVDILRFINGVRIFPCGDGDDYKLTDEDIHNVNEYINNLPVKTKAEWTANFDDYVNPGDIVEEAIVDEFMNCLPPVSMLSVCAQCGEPYSHKKDPNNNKIRATYATFTRIDNDKWMYCGHCFANQTYPNGIKMPYC